MRAVVLLLLALPDVLSLPKDAWAYDVERQVVRIVDGNTFRFESLDPEVQPSHVCRMLGYDAPESFILEGDNWRPTGNPEAEAATERLSELVGGRTVRIRAERKGTYGRWLCQVWLLNGTNVNEEMGRFLRK